MPRNEALLLGHMLRKAPPNPMLAAVRDHIGFTVLTVDELFAQLMTEEGPPREGRQYLGDK